MPVPGPPAAAPARVWKENDALEDVLTAAVDTGSRLAKKLKKWIGMVGDMPVKAWRGLSAEDKVRLPLDLIGTLNAELNPPAAPAPAPGADFDVRGCGVSVAVRVWVCWTEMAVGLWEMLCRRVPRFALFQPGLLLVFL